MKFFEVDPTLESYWRSILLFGMNSASYKFALAHSLIEVAQQQGNDLVSLESLAEPFSRHLCRHLSLSDRQGSRPQSIFLDACRSFNNGSLSQDELILETTKRGFVNVIDAFHVVNRDDVPRRFFMDERKSNGGIRVTDALYQLFANDSGIDLMHETEARWRLVETAWDLNISRNLIKVDFDPETERLLTSSGLRRVDITSSRDALNGYQRGKCLYCCGPISIDSGAADLADVDHFFPHMLMHTPDFQNLNGVWNLALSCKECNRGDDGKFARLPSQRLLERLNARNEYLITSHHPLRETLMQQTGKSVKERTAFLRDCYTRAAGYLNPNSVWEPPLRGTPIVE